MPSGRGRVVPDVPVARGTATRFLAEGTWALCALATGAIVGRQLGPDGKGVTSALTYLIATVGTFCALGLGEAGVRFVRNREATLDVAVTSALAGIAVATTAGAAAFVGLAVLEFGPLVHQLDGSVAAGVITLPMVALWLTLSLLLESQGKLVETAAVRVFVGAATLLATAWLVLKAHRGIAGAVLAGGIGYAGGVALLLALLWRAGVRPRPQLRRDYLARALRVGIPIQAATLLVGMSARADVLLVQSLKDGVEAGLYSVALTMSQLVLFGPLALSTATFPVLAGLDEARVGPYVARTARAALALSLTTAVVVAATVPHLVPRAFGEGFRKSVPTTLLLLPSAVLYSQQWILCRAWAARGHGRLVVASFAWSTGVMLTADVALVPWLGRTGAALGAGAGGIAGVARALSGVRAGDHAISPWSLMVPDWRDLFSVVAAAVSPVGRGRRA